MMQRPFPLKCSYSFTSIKVTPTYQAVRVVITIVPATSRPTQVPTLISTTVSTPIPTQLSTPTAVPTQPPSRVNGNPWGYNFVPGNFITSPPATFCNYFSCINNFHNGHEYVEECSDGMHSLSGGIRGVCQLLAMGSLTTNKMHSLSGGIRGVCSYHDGAQQPLYSHQFSPSRGKDLTDQQ